MDTNFLKLLLILVFAPVIAFAQYPSTPNSPYTVRWYQVSQDSTLSGNSRDSVVSQHALHHWVTDYIETLWETDANGIHYSNNVGIGGDSHKDYRLLLNDDLGIYQTALSTVTNQYNLTGSARVWYNVINGTNYKISTTTDPFIIQYAAPLNSLVLTSSGVGIWKANPTSALDVSGSAKVSGTLTVGTSGLGNHTYDFVVRNSSTGAYGHIPLDTIYANNFDSTLFERYGLYIYPKGINWQLGIGINAPEELIHIKDTTDSYYKTTAIGPTGVAGIIYENDDQIWSDRIRGDISDQYEIYDNSNNKIPFSIQKNSPTYALRVNADSSVAVYDFYVGDTANIPNAPLMVSAPYVSMFDQYGNIGKKDITDFEIGGVGDTTAHLTDGYGIVHFDYNQTTDQIAILDTSEIKSWVNGLIPTPEEEGDTAAHLTAGFGLSGTYYNQTADVDWEVDTNNIATVYYVNESIKQYIFDPDASILTKGTTESGNVNSADEHDISYWQLNEVAGIPGFDVKLVYDSVDRTPTQIWFSGYYNGSASHTVELQLYNYEDAVWEVYTTIPTSTTTNWYTINIADPLEHVRNDSAQVRFYHSSNGNITHDMFIDYCVLVRAGSGGSSDHGALTGLTDDDHLQYPLLDGRVGDVLHMDTIKSTDEENGTIHLKNLTYIQDGIHLTAGPYNDGGRDIWFDDGGNYFIDFAEGIATMTFASQAYQFGGLSGFGGIYFDQISFLPNLQLINLGWSGAYRWRSFWSTNITDDSTQVRIKSPDDSTYMNVSNEKIKFHVTQGAYDNLTELELTNEYGLVYQGSASLFESRTGGVLNRKLLLNSAGFSLDDTQSVDTINTVLQNDDYDLPTSGAVWDAIQGIEVGDTSLFTRLNDTIYGKHNFHYFNSAFLNKAVYDGGNGDANHSNTITASDGNWIAQLGTRLIDKRKYWYQAQEADLDGDGFITISDYDILGGITITKYTNPISNYNGFKSQMYSYHSGLDAYTNFRVRRKLVLDSLGLGTKNIILTASIDPDDANVYAVQRVPFDSILNNIPQYWSRDAVNLEVYPTNANDQLGLGTANPIEKLDVKGNVNIGSGGTGQQTLYFVENGDINMTGFQNVATPYYAINFNAGEFAGVQLMQNESTDRIGFYPQNSGMALGDMANAPWETIVGRNIIADTIQGKMYGDGTNNFGLIIDGVENIYFKNSNYDTPNYFAFKINSEEDIFETDFATGFTFDDFGYFNNDLTASQELYVGDTLFHTPYDLTLDAANDGLMIWDANKDAYGKILFSSLPIAEEGDTAAHLIDGYGIYDFDYNQVSDATVKVDTAELKTWVEGLTITTTDIDSLDNLEDVTITNGDSGDILRLDDFNQWVNTTPPWIESEVDGVIGNEGDTTKHHTVGWGLSGAFYNQTNNVSWEVDTSKVATQYGLSLISAGGDNLGNHNATQRLDMANNDIERADTADINTVNLTNDLIFLGGGSIYSTSGDIQIVGSGYKFRPGVPTQFDDTVLVPQVPITTGKDTILVLGGNMMYKQKSTFLTGLPASALEWSDTTAANGVGIATYDDLRNLPVGDNLGNHTMTTELQTSDQWISNDGSSDGIYVDDANNVGISTSTVTQELTVGGDAAVNDTLFVSSHARIQDAVISDDFVVQDSSIFHDDVQMLGTLRADQRIFQRVSTDSTWSGDAVYFPYDITSSGTIYKGQLLYFNSANYVDQADCDAASTMGCIGMALEKKTTGTGDMLVLIRGFYKYTPWSITSIDEGKPLYVSTTAGNMEVTAPTGDADINQIVGYVYNAANEVVFINIDLTGIEVNVP